MVLQNGIEKLLDYVKITKKSIKNKIDNTL